jgi:hypothetical protein
MYRCCACDSPAMMNCACHTQLERPEGAFEEKKVNIASGEDIPEEVEEMIA